MRSAFEGERRWPGGHKELTLLAVPDLHRDAATGTGSRLATLLDGVRTVVSPFPGTSTPVPDAGLHVTIQPINHGLYDTPPIGRTTVTKLVDDLTILLRDRPAFPLWMGSPVIGQRGIVLDHEPLSDGPFDDSPEDPFSDLVDDVRTVIARVCGPGAIGHDTRPCHMALVYASCDQETEDFSSVLRRVRPSHAFVMVRTLVLAWVRQSPTECCYQWKVVKRFQLTEHTGTSPAGRARSGRDEHSPALPLLQPASPRRRAAERKA
ncbi:hypothetical protein [Amycolatopsis sp. lyj-112]|uniref:hypothetical protein n=1 Tax=Amycolatopsis sp. lyj-112 TaxID=2789288 RepID=UPI00397C6F00